MRDGDFYVGWQEHAPTRLAVWLRGLALMLLLTVTFILGLLAWRQGRLPSGRFEFGVSRTFTGVLHESPMARLRLVEDSAGLAASTQVLLVGYGKQGLPEWARGHDGRRVRFRGSLIHHENLVMIEMNEPESFEVLPLLEASVSEVVEASLGPVTLTGELVDTKCYLGVMRPATGKVHRACAVRCLAGGVPPGLLVRHVDGSSTVFLLAADGEPLDIDPQLAARTLTVTGEVRVLGELPVLLVDRLMLQGSGT